MGLAPGGKPTQPAWYSLQWGASRPKMVPFFPQGSCPGGNRRGWSSGGSIWMPAGRCNGSAGIAVERVCEEAALERVLPLGKPAAGFGEQARPRNTERKNTLLFGPRLPSE